MDTGRIYASWQRCRAGHGESIVMTNGQNAVSTGVWEAIRETPFA